MLACGLIQIKRALTLTSGGSDRAVLRRRIVRERSGVVAMRHDGAGLMQVNPSINRSPTVNLTGATAIPRDSLRWTAGIRFPPL